MRLRVPLVHQVAFACGLIERRAIKDFDPAPSRPDAAALLERMRDHRHGGALHAEDLRAGFLRYLDLRALESVACLQQPAAQPRFN